MGLGGTSVNLHDAVGIAEKYKAQLKPFCDQIEIAGSIRRKKPDVGDIEIVCIPHQQIDKVDLFSGVSTRPVPGFISTVNMWRKVKGEPTGKYTQRQLVEGINLDLFIATKENWGLIFAIRTGSAEFSHQVLATGWVKAGYESVNGMLRKNGETIAVPEEEDLFKLIGKPFIPPEDRNL